MESQSLTQVQYQIICLLLLLEQSFSFLFFCLFAKFSPLGNQKNKGYDLCIGVFGKKKT